MQSPIHDMTDRAEGALFGLAIGDALGMPSQTLVREEICERYGRIEGFVAPFEGHEVSHGLRAAQVTDDTEQTLLLARRLIADPVVFDDKAWAQDLLSWEAGIRRRGLRDILGPSTKSAIEALLLGTPPTETGLKGTTNGAAMRIAPVGIMMQTDAASLVEKVAQTARVTHNTGEAISAASAVAMMVSAGIAGESIDDALASALGAAQLGQTYGSKAGVADMVDRIATAVEIGRTGDVGKLVEATGSSVQSHESIPAAFGLLTLCRGDGWKAMLLAANIGDDTDTIGAIVGAMCGAFSGKSGLPADAVAAVTAANDLDIPAIAGKLVSLRQKSDSRG
ncbi:ADP-ribosylglycohydrolase family protein [Paracoccus albus]|uniref:ADP-ribosylglycohydrolase family protein n=1 Tax=Paracoccus albus TaxID=3017784 RepID=UPI0022F02973|nr:ADP-ribosylglycohydrolase family protein [Paracoccus albus]WBU62119.1 ADP-ribosylglycohydrolase family protein [Paracoccus albus]